MSGTTIKPGGVILIIGFAAAIVGFGVYAYQKEKNPTPPVTNNGGGSGSGSNNGGAATNGGGTTGGGEAGGEVLGGTTQKEFKEVGRAGAPQLSVPKGSYAWDDANPTVVFPINIWAGWGPIIAANDGFAPGSPRSVFKKYGFNVELRLIDDPVQTAEAYASGQAHTMWGTLDMIALFAPELKKVGLTPKVFQQVDWSQGGDGIVVRSSIRSVKDLAGKTIALCQNSPSHYYILRLLADVGLSHRDVNFRFTQTAFGASALFAQDPRVHACVSWAPDIYTLTETNKSVRLLSTTADAANVIADVWAARPDFASDHPDVIKGLVKGIFEGVDLLAQNPDRVAALMASGYHFPVDECKGMLGDAYSTGLADNVQFFDKGNAAGFAATWESAVDLYGKYGAVANPVSADEVLDTSAVMGLKGENAFPHQTAQKIGFTPPKLDLGSVEMSESEEILRVTHRIQFEANASKLDEKVDPTLPDTLKKIESLAKRFSGAMIIIEGNVDTSKRSQFNAMGARVMAKMSERVQQLSQERADSVRAALLKKFPGEDNRFVAIGNGWDNPIDLVHHEKNRRVDVRVVRVE
ncbi:MAG: ABC transporter substrate-binding protein [Planctomycetes bacterium]|nr:ABC transporter substrate-binding protein [Planctomycetota bacterium]